MLSSSGSRPVSATGQCDVESEKSLLDAASEDDDGELHGGGDGGDDGGISPARRILIVATLAAASVSGDLTSMPAFYTTAALDKNPGAGPGYHTLIGGVYSIFMVAGACSIPLLIKDLPNIGSKNLIVLSHFITGSSLLVFASVTTITDWRVFIAYSFCIRILLGIAFVMQTMTVMTYLIAMYPTNLGFVSAFQMGCLAGGHVVGVMVGGAFYDFGGFKAPFLFGGTVNLVVCSVLFVLLIDIDSMNLKKRNGGKEVKLVRVGTILRSPWVWLMTVTLAMANIGNTGVDPVLGPRMHSTLNSPAVVVGSVIAVKGIGTSVASLFVGALLDRGVYPPLLIIVGMLCETLGLFVIGPIVFVHETPPLWQLLVGVSPLSLTNILMQASSVVSMSQHLEHIGVGNAVELRFAVASLSRFSLTSGHALGSLIFTSTVAILGFPLALTSIGVLYAGMAVLMVFLSWLHRVALKLRRKQAGCVNAGTDDEMDDQ
eukprot:scpid98269/ scgid35615/ 